MIFIRWWFFLNAITTIRKKWELWRQPFLRICHLCSYSRIFPAIYATRKFITVFTRSLHWSLSWARSIQSIPSHHISLRSIFNIPRPKSHVIFFRRGRLSKESVQGPLWSIVTRWGLLSPMPNPQAGGPPLVGCPRLLIQYIRSYPTYLGAVSFIRILRTRHAVVTRDPPNMGQPAIVNQTVWRL
jgi:hypothetical protein